MISGKINNIHMVVILLLCKETHYLFHNNWLLFWGMSLISMVLFRFLILIRKMLLGKNLTSSDILQETKNLHLINHPYSQGDNFHLKNWSPLNTFKIKNQRYVPELKKKKKKTSEVYLLKEEKCYKNRKSNFPFQTYFVTLCLFWDALSIFHWF